MSNTKYFFLPKLFLLLYPSLTQMYETGPGNYPSFLLVPYAPHPLLRPKYHLLFIYSWNYSWNSDSTSSHALCQFIYEFSDPSRVTVAICTYLYADITMLWSNLGLKHNHLHALGAWEKIWHLLSVQ